MKDFQSKHGNIAKLLTKISTARKVAKQTLLNVTKQAGNKYQSGRNDGAHETNQDKVPSVVTVGEQNIKQN